MIYYALIFVGYVIAQLTGARWLGIFFCVKIWLLVKKGERVFSNRRCIKTYVTESGLSSPPSGSRVSFRLPFTFLK
jgi:hypothetical protein